MSIQHGDIPWGGFTLTQPHIEYVQLSTTPAWETMTVPPNTGCEWCNGVGSYTIHGGLCPKIKAIEYYPDGVSIKRIEFKDAV